MSIRYTISGSTANGDYLCGMMGAELYQCELSSIQFFDQNGAQVTPSAGAVVFTGTPDGLNWRNIHGGSFLAADAYKPDRVPPYAEGLMVYAKITLSGVTGASTFSATLWRR